MLAAAWASEVRAQDLVLVEAEGFADKGGWLTDPQFMDVMGSPYLLAHGLGRQVKSATTPVTLPRGGTWHVFARTRDWVAPHGPGRFRVLVNGKPLASDFGHGGSGKWEWQYGGAVEVSGTNANVALQDLTGYDARVDALVFAASRDAALPAEGSALLSWRKALLGLSERPRDEGFYDLVVVGGGLAGIGAAVSAARMGLKVALIQNRPVLGGNSSSEIRVHIMGAYQRNPYPVLGEIVAEIQPHNEPIPENGEEPGRFHDARKLALVKAEPNISLFLNHHVNGVVKARTDTSRITAVLSRHVEANSEHVFRGYLFADCTGDGTVGYLAGASFMMGRESKADFGEPSAPAARDNLLMGFSNQWVAKPAANPLPVTPLAWAHAMPANRAEFLETLKTGDFNARIRGEWFWEGGIGRDKFAEAEYIRDNNFRAVFGYFHWLRSASSAADKYSRWDLEWVAHIAGRRESRRLVGDLVLTEKDLVGNVLYPDAAVTSTWSIDVHLPHPTNYLDFGNDAFISKDYHTRTPDYPVPYRCLYSRDIRNLFMAGRNISVSHIALGKTRVMATAGMMGEVVGRAAHLSRLHVAAPREIYRNHLTALLETFRKTARYSGTYPRLPDSLTTSLPGRYPRPGASFGLSARTGSGGVAAGFTLPKEAAIELEVSDLSGRRVGAVARKLAAGANSLEIPLMAKPSGIHLVRLRVGTDEETVACLLENR